MSGPKINDLEKLFSSLSGEKCIVAAVSGGSDSLAMLHMLHDWNADKQLCKIVAVTVDHGLRAASASEAEYVADLCQAMNITHVVKNWQGDKPETGLSAQARIARYQLLAKAADEVSAKVILTAHTLNDQHETVLMRAARLENFRFDVVPDAATSPGLAGIQSEGSYCGPPNFTPIRLVRPLLGHSRQRLREYLNSKDIQWMDDPSNEDVKYERVQVRQAIEANSGNIPPAREISDFAAKVVQQRQLLSARSADFIASNVALNRYGVISIQYDHLACLSKNAAIWALRPLIAMAGGQDYLISAPRISQLIDELSGQQAFKTTLGGSIIERTDNMVRFWRENRDLRNVEIRPNCGISIQWDGRTVCHFGDQHRYQELLMASLGQSGLAIIEADTGTRIRCKPRAALLVQPTIYHRSNIVFVPGIGWKAHGFQPPACRWWSPALEFFSTHSDRDILRSVKFIRKKALVE